LRASVEVGVEGWEFVCMGGTGETGCGWVWLCRVCLRVGEGV
jgi:hypothetical protein